MFPPTTALDVGIDHDHILGIGYEIVKSLATSRSDYQVLLGSRDVKKGEAAAASMGALINVNPIQIDITDDQSVDTCHKAIEQHFGR